MFRQQLHTSSRKSRFPVLALVGILVFAAAENVPTIYAFSVDRSDGSVGLTEYGRSAGFEAYSWWDALLFQFAPFLLLSTFNVVLAVHLLRHRRLSQRLKAGLPRSFLQQRLTAERRTLAMLTGIIGLFLVTMVPCSAMQLVGTGLDYDSDAYRHLQMAVTVLVSLNFSCNFLLYCLLNRRFCQVLTALLCPCCSRTGNRVGPARLAPGEPGARGAGPTAIAPGEPRARGAGPTAVAPGEPSVRGAGPTAIAPGRGSGGGGGGRRSNGTSRANGEAGSRRWQLRKEAAPVPVPQGTEQQGQGFHCRRDSTVEEGGRGWALTASADEVLGIDEQRQDCLGKDTSVKEGGGKWAVTASADEVLGQNCHRRDTTVKEGGRKWPVTVSGDEAPTPVPQETEQ